MSFQSAPPPGREVPCSYHPSVMTGLRCSRCGKPICPRCAVRTPVGMRCPDCAGVRGLPTYRTESSTLIRAVGAGLLIALVTALLWRQGPAWSFYLSMILGFGVVEAMARVANYKRGADLRLAAFAVITIGLVLSRVLLAQRFGVTLNDVNAMSDAIATPQVVREYGGFPSLAYVLRIRLVPDLLYAIIPYAVAWYRFR